MTIFKVQFLALLVQIEPLTTYLPAAARLVAIGDLHGDMGKTRRAFKIGGLIDDRGHWTGGTTTAVQVVSIYWTTTFNVCMLKCVI